MAMRGGPRLPVGSAAWVAEERSSALNIAQSEIEEFSFSARNEMDWLNEHMAEIFSENQMNVAELFKTPGKLRGRTPRTAKKATPSEGRVPLSDIFSSTPKGAPNPFALSTSSDNQAQTPRIRVAEDRRDQTASRPTSPAKTHAASPRPAPAKAPIPVVDSGYHGSQSDFDYQEVDIEMATQSSPQQTVDTADFAVFSAPIAHMEKASPTAAPEETFHSAKEEQTRAVAETTTRNLPTSPPVIERQLRSPVLTRAPPSFMSPHQSSPRRIASPPKSSPYKSSHKSSPYKSSHVSSPQRSSPQKGSSSPLKTVTEEHEKGFPKPTEELNHTADEQDDDDIRSPSEASSPIRPIVRKSSLNFASLPAREPLTSRQSIKGNAGSSFYNRPTGGKSLGNVFAQDPVDDDQDEMDVDDEPKTQQDDTTNITMHAKTYTQRLQDQISMLGKSQSIGPRPSKSIAHLLPAQNPPATYTQPVQTPLEVEFKKPSSPPKQSVAAPGAFPEDDDDDWISPPEKTVPVASPARPQLAKSYTADVMEGFAGKESLSEFTFPSRSNSPAKAPVVPVRTTNTPKHGKSASVPTLPMHDPFITNADNVGLKKTISVSNPTLATVSEYGHSSTPKSSRTFRDSPLKQVKNKLSSILKSSKGLLASSAAISAEGKSSLLSPSTTRLGFHHAPSVDSFRTAENVMYPDLSQHPSNSRPVSPARTNSTRRTRASTEREKKEQKDKTKEAKEREKEIEKEAKEAKRLAEQMKKLEKIREKEQEKARVFSKEQEKKIAALEKSAAAQKEKEKSAQEKSAQAQQAVQTPAPPKTAPRSPPKPTRTSPRKVKGQADADMCSDELDIDMVDAPVTMPPPSVARPTASSMPRIPGTATKRPIKPTKESSVKPKQPPKLIRVNTVSQNPQFHPSNSMLAASLEDTLGPQQNGPSRQLNSKASQSSLHTKSSLQSLNGSSKRPKALDMAARRKAEEEREVQRKRDVKQENDRKRAAAEEERRQEQQRKIDAEKQEEERRRQATKKAAIERAKQTKAPPPASRLQPNGPPDYSMADKGPSRPPSRLGSMMQQDRPVNTMLSKSTAKRPLQDTNDDNSRPQATRNQPTYQSQEAKRMRMSEEFDDDIETADTQRPLKASAIRPPSIYKTTDMSTKQSIFSSGYGQAPPQSMGPKPTGPKDLFRTTVTKQHTIGHTSKPANPMDMAQVSKGDIPGLSHKTPVRPPGSKQPPPKSAARSSPRYQNGEAIDLPDIETDDDDEDEDVDMPMAPWANSPALRSALMRQEDMDPMQIFGPPAPLNMEEVFSKDKGRWHKFRARTSSANWSGPDRLTEEEERRDLRARDKIRKQGGWSYDLSKEL